MGGVEEACSEATNPGVTVAAAGAEAARKAAVTAVGEIQPQAEAASLHSDRSCEHAIHCTGITQSAKQDQTAVRRNGTRATIRED